MERIGEMERNRRDREENRGWLKRRMKACMERKRERWDGQRRGEKGKESIHKLMQDVTM